MTHFDSLEEGLRVGGGRSGRHGDGAIIEGDG